MNGVAFARRSIRQAARGGWLRRVLIVVHGRLNRREPSTVRWSLAHVPEPEGATFVDLGCGKGRALVLASETRLKDIVGVELSADLAALAGANADLATGGSPRGPASGS